MSIYILFIYSIMPKLTAYKASITNRGPESGGSVGGNSKAGLVNFSLYGLIDNRSQLNRLGGACCSKTNATNGGTGK